MPAFVLAIFLSAFLLFQVQPIIARYILPWYGGSPAVWTSCMLFFQVGLLAGYAYAHLLVSWFRDRPRWQAGIHLGLLVVSLFLLPITPDGDLKPTGAAENPVGGILHLLVVTVGLPYVVISASGPLLQHWFASSKPGASPYRLYAISNLGSLLGLLTYPPLVEPRLRLGEQTVMWSIVYLVYFAAVAACARILVRGKPVAKETQASPRALSTVPGLDRFLWVALAGCGSLLLLATTNQMCQDVAVVPFLWVLPLSLYLLTFIIAFDHERWYRRMFWIPLAVLFLGLQVYLLNRDFANDELLLALQVGIYVGTMFTACMVCHGEMVRLKPHPDRLTGFYLAVALGGALGGAFVSLVAPRIFSSYWELHVGLLLFAALAGFCLFRGASTRTESPSRLAIGGSVTGAVGFLALAFFLLSHVSKVSEDAILTTRGFYGVLRVYETDVGTRDHCRSLFHGRINHGRQYQRDPWRTEAYAYYGENSGPGLFFKLHPHRQTRTAASLKVGVVGLGVGVLAAHLQSGDSIRFYEINSQVEDLARSHFTYLADCLGEEAVVPGDARIVLEQELAKNENQKFDALFIDAFSGDSIPIHLLTREAFELYFDHLAPDGVLVVHITNWHIDLSDPVRTVARDLGKEVLLVENDPEAYEENYSQWVLLASNRELLDWIASQAHSSTWDREKAKEIRWTDDYSNLFEVIDWE